jgi:hypothetical protein
MWYTFPAFVKGGCYEHVRPMKKEGFFERVDIAFFFAALHFLSAWPITGVAFEDSEILPGEDERR